MAQKVQTVLISDLSGEELGDSGQTVSFALHGVEYQIDLAPEEADDLTAVMQNYINAARRVGARRRGRSNQGSAPTDREQLRKMREWARENGYQVSNKGRIPKEVQDAYHAAN